MSPDGHLHHWGKRKQVIKQRLNTMYKDMYKSNILSKPVFVSVTWMTNQISSRNLSVPVFVSVTWITNQIIINVHLKVHKSSSLRERVYHIDRSNVQHEKKTWSGLRIYGQLSHASPTLSPSRSIWSALGTFTQLSLSFFMPEQNFS